jgi:hypothetical protein
VLLQNVRVICYSPSEFHYTLFGERKTNTEFRLSLSTAHFGISRSSRGKLGFATTGGPFSL